MIKKLAIILLVLFWTGLAFGGNIEVDPQLSNYSKQGGVSGNVSSVGSDTLNNLMTLWSEKFKQFYPNINIQVEGKGSSTAPPALISATAQLGPMSRAMKQKEIDAFESKFGYKPTPVRVAVDAPHRAIGRLQQGACIAAGAEGAVHIGGAIHRLQDAKHFF